LDTPGELGISVPVGRNREIAAHIDRTSGIIDIIFHTIRENHRET
jgi:hypothetical protein